MVQLENTMEYEDLYDDIARLHFGDTCYCTVAKLGIEVAERMIEYTWYPTLGKYKSVTLGNDIEFYPMQRQPRQQSFVKRLKVALN